MPNHIPDIHLSYTIMATNTAEQEPVEADVDASVPAESESVLANRLAYEEHMVGWAGMEKQVPWDVWLIAQDGLKCDCSPCMFVCDCDYGACNEMSRLYYDPEERPAFLKEEKKNLSEVLSNRFVRLSAEELDEEEKQITREKAKIDAQNRPTINLIQSIMSARAHLPYDVRDLHNYRRELREWEDRLDHHTKAGIADKHFKKKIERRRLVIKEQEETIARRQVTSAEGVKTYIERYPDRHWHAHQDHLAELGAMTSGHVADLAAISRVRRFGSNYRECLSTLEQMEKAIDDPKEFLRAWATHNMSMLRYGCELGFDEMQEAMHDAEW